MEPTSTSSVGSNSSNLDSDINPAPFTVDREDPNLENFPRLVNAYYLSDAIPNDIEIPRSKESLWRKTLFIIRPGYIIDHLDYGSFKVAVRTWLQVWISAILCAIPGTSHWMGSAAYLMQIIGFIAVAGGTPIIMNIYISFAAILFSCFAWVHAIIAMKLNNRFHDYITQDQLARKLIDEGSCTVDNISQCMIDNIFSGRYLQVRSAVVYCLAIITCFTIMGLAQSLQKTLRVAFVAGVIALIINCCYGVFFPIFDPLEIGLSVMKPMGLAFALKSFLAVVIFPTTASFQYLDGSAKLLKGLKKASENHLRLFKTLKPSADNFSGYKQYSSDITSIRNKLGALEIMAGMAKLEVSYGRFDLGDLGEFRSLLKNLVSISSGYNYYYETFSQRRNFALQIFSNYARRSSAASVHRSEVGTRFLTTVLHESYKKVGEFENSNRENSLKKRFWSIDPKDRVTLEDLDNIADFIKEHFQYLLQVSDEVFQLLIEWLSAANNYRTYSLLFPSQRKSHVLKQKENHKRLLAAKEKLESVIVEVCEKACSQAQSQFTGRNEEVLLCLLSQVSLFLYLSKRHSYHLLKMVDLFLSIDAIRPEPVLITWFTNSKREVPKNIMRVHSDSNEVPQFLSSNVQTRDPDSLPPDNFIQVLGKYFVKVYYLLLRPDIWFWIRSGILVCVGATPYFVRTTANWYYSNRLIWLVIMIGVSTSESVGETMYVIWSKLFYSFFGSLLGLVGWYISAGRGPGNYYGYSAVTAVIYIYLSYYRHFSIHLTFVPAILFAVTTALVLGTSWIDGQFNKLANVGEGFRVAWIRFVSVVIGLTIGLFACLIPKPLTSKYELRHILSNVIEETGNLHSDISSFAMKRLEDPSYHLSSRHDKITERLRYALLQLAGTSSLMVPLHHEIPLTGYWPEEKYRRLQTILIDITQLYFYLFSIFNLIEDPKKWNRKILRKVGWTNSSIVADIFTILHMSADALKTCNSLPKITSSNTSLKHIDSLMHQWGINRISINERFYRDDGNLDSGLRSTLKDSTNDSNLDYNTFFSHDGQLLVVSLLFAHMIYKRLDELMILIKGLVGEKFDYDSSIFEDEEYNDETTE
ncbi:uncharacterized protein RJT21DRAFT_122722 [Scheffersomyces amazonensis]|uniref:uncharacterized protein n=1 Tax=Scheffersomyces amazonensis TaxID=1078765 RepID=UPI00315D8093